MKEQEGARSQRRLATGIVGLDQILDGGFPERRLYLLDWNCTILLIDSPQPSSPDMLLQSLVHGVVTVEQLAPPILTVAQQGLVFGEGDAPIDVSYLADNVMLVRYFEMEGQVRKSLAVLKKRSGAHESTIRELILSGEGVRVGPPPSQFRGILAGAPQPTGGAG